MCLNSWYCQWSPLPPPSARTHHGSQPTLPCRSASCPSSSRASCCSANVSSDPVDSPNPHAVQNMVVCLCTIHTWLGTIGRSLPNFWENDFRMPFALVRRFARGATAELGGRGISISAAEATGLSSTLSVTLVGFSSTIDRAPRRTSIRSNYQWRLEIICGPAYQ